MKIKHVIMAFTFALVAGLGTIGALNINKKVEVKEADANTPVTASNVFRFTNNGGWGSVYAYSWKIENETEIKLSGDWPGTQLTDYYINDMSQGVHLFVASETPDYIIFNAGNGQPQTGNLDASSSHAWYWDTAKRDAAPCDIGTKTYYLYDYLNMFNNAAQCYAWRGTSLENAVYPGVAMTKAALGSGQLYTVELDEALTNVKFGIGDSANTGNDVTLGGNADKCFCWWNVGDGQWKTLNEAKAHDWVYQLMHVRDILPSNEADTNACRGDNGYYKKARDAYNSFETDIRTLIQNDENFSIATARFAAWATACGFNASISGTTLNESNSLIPLPISNKNDTATIIVIISVLSVAALGGFFFVRKRKEER